MGIQGLGTAIGVVVLYLVLVFGASESGEVVQLVTEDAQGEAVTTRLWVADTDGAMWLRAGDGTSGWYQRLTAHSAHSPATLIRGDHTYAITASPEPSAHRGNQSAHGRQVWAGRYTDWDARGFSGVWYRGQSRRCLKLILRGWLIVKVRSLLVVNSPEVTGSPRFGPVSVSLGHPAP